MKRFLLLTLVSGAALCTASCFGDSKRDVSQDLARAESYRKAGDLPKAIVELRHALEKKPTDPPTNLALAELEEATGDVESAIPHYIRAAAPEARLIEPQLRVVQVLIDSERYPEATGRINTTIGAFPGNADALALRADLEERQGLTAQAEIDVDAALQKDRKNPRAAAVLAMLRLRDKNATAAVDIADRALTLHPSDLRLLEVKAAALLTTDHPEQAVEVLRSIVRNAPRNVAVRSALAQVEARNGHLDDAIANFRTAVDADPSNQQLQLAFVAFLSRQDKASDLVAFLQSLIGSNLKTGIYDRLLAEYMRSQGKVDQANIILQKAAERLKGGKEFLATRVAQAKLKDFDGHVGAAGRDIDAVLAVDPQNEEALLFGATLDQGSGRPAAAVERLLTLLRQNPASARAFQLLAACYLSMGQPESAVSAMQRAVAVVPNDQAAQIGLAAFLQRAGKFDASRELMARLTLQNPDSKTVWASNAQFAIDRKDWNAANASMLHLRQMPGTAFELTILNGRLKAARGDNAGAAKNYQDAIASDSSIDPAMFGVYARASVAAGSTLQAADFLEQNVSRVKDDALQQAWAAIMNLRADAGQFDKADAAFRKAQQLTPKNAALYTGYVRILAAQKKFDRSQQVIAEGLRAGAPRTDMLLLAGGIEELRGDLKAAMKDYQEILNDDSLSLQAANNYANLLSDQDPQNIEALRKARDGLNGAEANADVSVLDTIAWLDYRLGRLDEAKQILERINAGKSPSPQVRFHLAAVLLASGDRPQGAALLDTLKNLDFPGAEEARSLSAS